MTATQTPTRQDCAEVSALLDTFADGELSRELTLSVQQHLNHCQRCTAIVEGAGSLKKHLRAAVYEDAPVSSDFLARMQGALVAEEARVNAEEHRTHGLGAHGLGAHGLSAHGLSAHGLGTHGLGPHFGPLSWRTIMPLVAAACALFWVSMKRTQPSTEDRMPYAQAPSVQPGVQADAIKAHSVDALVNKASPVDTAALDEALDELIDYHSAPPASQVKEPQLVQQMERDVGVRVHLPSFAGERWTASKDLRSLGVPQWQGATVVPVRNQRAAYFRYKVGGHWVTLYMYNSGRFPVHRKLEERVVRDLPVYVGERRGYSIAARERKGIGYAVATDFSDTDSAELVASIH